MTEPLPVPGALPVRWALEDDAVRVPRHYGDAAAEYRAATASAVVVDRNDRAIVRLWGRDPARILQGIITNDITLAAAGRAVFGALLTPKGRMIAEVRVLRRGDEFLLEPGAAALPAVLESFRRTIPPLFARFGDASAGLHVLGVYGPAAADALAQTLEGELPVDREDALSGMGFEGETCQVVDTRITGEAGYDVVATTATAKALWQALGARGVQPMGHAALDVLRIEAGVPRWGAELTPETIPLEAGLQARAISTTKGCYTGQEVIVRILHRGHVNRLLRGVLLGESASPARGEELLEPGSGKVVGRVTSAAWSPRLEQEIALAYVRREAEPGTELRLRSLEGGVVRVVALPFTA